MKKFLIFIFMLCLVIPLIGCPAIQKQSPKDIYYKALGFWVDTNSSFKYVFENSTKEKQKEMMPALAMLLEAKRNVLNPWRDVVLSEAGSMETIYSLERQWRPYENKIILEVIRKYLTKKE